MVTFVGRCFRDGHEKMGLQIFRPGKTWSSLHSYTIIEKRKSILISNYRKGVENLNRQRIANALISLHRCAF